jgi:hypothetical protein
VNTTWRCSWKTLYPEDNHKRTAVGKSRRQRTETNNNAQRYYNRERRVIFVYASEICPSGDELSEMDWTRTLLYGAGQYREKEEASAKVLSKVSPSPLSGCALLFLSLAVRARL